MATAEKPKKFHIQTQYLNHKYCCELIRYIWQFWLLGGKLWQRFRKSNQNFSFSSPRSWTTWHTPGGSALSWENPVFKIRDSESSSLTLRDTSDGSWAQNPCYNSYNWGVAMWALPEVKCSHLTKLWSLDNFIVPKFLCWKCATVRFDMILVDRMPGPQTNIMV